MNEQGHRRIDRIRQTTYVEKIADLPLEELRARRDECMSEREYLSLLRRLVQGRAEILKAQLGSRGDAADKGPLVERLAQILGGDEQRTTSRGEAVKVGVPEEEMLLARRRIERLVADAGISDPTSLDDEKLGEAVELLSSEERVVSKDRRDVLQVLDVLQDELKRRYKEDPTLALR